MRVAGHNIDVLSQEEIDTIHHSALKILEKIGMEIENKRILEVLDEFGAQVDYSSKRARFTPGFVEQFISDSEEIDWTKITPRVSSSAGIYHGMYHSPISGKLESWTEDALIDYFNLPRYLEHVNGVHMLGCPLALYSKLEPLYERYYCWKYGAKEAGSIHLDDLSPYIFDLCQIKSQYENQLLPKIFRGVVYLVPPLKLARHEAYQFIYFWEKGLEVNIGTSLFAAGATAPVTLSGAVTLSIAENLALGILRRAFFDDKTFHISSAISVFDMRTMIRPYGRPEMAIANLMAAQMARYYGASFSGQCGLADAKLPSCEAGMQKALTAIPTLLVGGEVSIDAGLLSIDEVCSPIQMILDNEFMGALERFTKGFEVTEEAIGVDEICKAGPGGNFIATLHTAKRFRDEHWEPHIWSREMTIPWLKGSKMLDVDRARKRYSNLNLSAERHCRISSDFEKDLMKVITKAEKYIS